MGMLDHTTTFADAVAHDGARAVLDRYLPGFAGTPQAGQLGPFPLGVIARTVPALRDDAERAAAFWAELSDLDFEAAPRVHGPAITPDPRYEDDSVTRGSAACVVPAEVPRWGVAEIELRGPSHGNPFVDVDVWATFTDGDREIRCGGFYDGDGVYRIRMLAGQEGVWRFVTGSTARSLDGIEGEFRVGAAQAGRHGPVRVEGMHFRYADGTRYRPWGTTAYAWTHQSPELQRQTLDTLAASPFNKIRMCVNPKSFLYNTEEPDRLPFTRTGEGFDVTRFDVESFRNLERRVADLADRGIEADLILFHPYDRWGLADLGPAVDERLVTYTVRRLAAHANVWWSLSNEYDLVMAKTVGDWERIAEVVVREDPHDHLRSIHQCFGFYDNSRPWITHSSLQRVDVYRTAENTDQWRDQWAKPVVIDECGYEGDVEYGWGNLTGEEMVRRIWEGAVRGGYVGHGETYINEREELWWSKGGALTGGSPARYAFLETIVAESPTGVLDPLPSDWDLPWGGVPGRYLVGYVGFSRPRHRNVFLPEGRFRVDVVDTWNMTVESLPGTYESAVLVPLPARQFMAIRLVRVD
ncbi:DUF5605 domain-containing protein [Actinoplanes sp. NPDC051851]|uniref:DUF5605 domain-containing protein n=1 Tax=Actinoplanes sp. NPDC051851 TaxID=3154753 RepID=UPI00341C1D41